MFRPSTLISPARSAEQSRQHLHRRRFARAIRPQKSVKRPSLDRQVDAADGAKSLKYRVNWCVSIARVMDIALRARFVDESIDNNTGRHAGLAAHRVCFSVAMP